MTTPNNGQSSDSSSPIHRTTSTDEVQTHLTPGRLTHGPIWFYDVEEEEEVFEEDDDEDYDYEENTDIVVGDQVDGEDDDDEGDDGEGDDDEGDDDEGGNEEDDASAERILDLLRTGARTGVLTRGQLLALMRNPELTNVLFQDDIESDAEFLQWPPRRHRPRTPKDPNRFPKVPSEEGIKLMRSGAFGANDYNMRAKKHLAQRMLDSELAIGNQGERKRNRDLVAQSMIPRSRAEQIIHFDDPVYSGQFSDDGNFFFACSQDFKVRMYNTSNPYNWEHYKTVSYPWGQWTLTDASLSPDNKWLAYTSIQSLVSIAPTDPNDTGDPYTLELDDGTRRGFRRSSFGIWSIRFSGDGRELVAGTSSSSVVVYDIESRTVLHNIQAHNDDVNAVCFADKKSPHILYSGSDDTTIKVWDRRCMGSTREVGAFVGHIEGLTYIDSKGDGRYILSNGKDQSMKLWDMRMAYGTDRFHEIDPSHEQASDFDYRGGTYDEEDWSPHPKDNSVVTFRGHKVLRTLIRCHFSPESSTNSRYVYSGSADGKVYIWNLDATLAGTVDVKKATMGTRPADQHSRFIHLDEPGGWGTCVRDASWHPNAPVLVASAWNGYNMARGTCTLHSFNETMDDEGEPPMGRSVNDVLKPDPHLFQSTYPIP
ncbi:WD40-repeat-containing domain protein [Ilyonectria robusta]|uniref:WD40-repeat-containing domain protein n=1 Tax=Ilyonectria robusta TaxID=1079257 RepID=UPI001E8D815B|nr:WD40-repeat-containing domain protein [Ilyonectria robusta]KAH8659573.1 WD40-repeat-containing domain protein [Ilyonectria robusta]